MSTGKGWPPRRKPYQAGDPAPAPAVAPPTSPKVYQRFRVVTSCAWRKRSMVHVIDGAAALGDWFAALRSLMRDATADGCASIVVDVHPEASCEHEP